MRAGALNKLITIESYMETTDDFGGVTDTWAEFSKAWANISPLRGGEKYISSEKYATATHSITVRFIIGVLPKMRIVYQGRVFDVISSINAGERNKNLQIVAEEKL